MPSQPKERPLPTYRMTPPGELVEADRLRDEGRRLP